MGKAILVRFAESSRSRSKGRSVKLRKQRQCRQTVNDGLPPRVKAPLTTVCRVAWDYFCLISVELSYRQTTFGKQTDEAAPSKGATTAQLIDEHIVRIERVRKAIHVCYRWGGPSDTTFGLNGSIAQCHAALALDDRNHRASRAQGRTQSIAQWAPPLAL